MGLDVVRANKPSKISDFGESTNGNTSSHEHFPIREKHWGYSTWQTAGTTYLNAFITSQRTGRNSQFVLEPWLGDLVTGSSLQRVMPWTSGDVRRPPPRLSRLWRGHIMTFRWTQQRKCYQRNWSTFYSAHRNTVFSVDTTQNGWFMNAGRTSCHPTRSQLT